jgi:pullulanase
MGKWFVVLWLVGVVGTLSYMQWVMFDRSRGRPSAALATVGSGQGLGDALKQAGEDARKAVEQAGKDAADAAKKSVADATSTLVQPEDLPQGFIVVVTDKSKTASASSPIYMPSSHNGWNPGDAKMKLEAQSDMKWRIVWEKPKLDSRIAFKFARGSWETVETTPDFQDIDNRMLPKVDVSKLAPGEKPVIELTIEAWKDQQPGNPGFIATNRYRAIEVGAGRLERMEVVGGGARPGTSRDILVWLPPGYDDAANRSRSYPVLYLQDGQNVFEKLPNVPGEWKADETAARLITEGKIEPLIIVGIPHSFDLRAQEYMPVAALPGVEARGRDYLRFLVDEVMPRIERAYRVKTGPEHTAIGGASLGAVISLAAGQQHPDKFGAVLLESLPTRMGRGALFRHFGLSQSWPRKVYIGAGGKEGGLKADDESTNEQFVEGTKALVELARGRGVSAENLRLVIEPGAVHNEDAWAARFGNALEFLFPAGN